MARDPQRKKLLTPVWNRKGARTPHPGAADQSHGHGHSHSHGPAPRGSARVRRVLVCLTLPLVLANVVALIVMWPRHGSASSPLSSPAGAPPLIAATVVDIDLIDCTSQYDLDAGAAKCVLTTARLEGRTKGGTLATFEESSLSSIRLHLHDKIYVTQLGEKEGRPTYGFYEFQREKPVLFLLVAFIITAVAIGRRAGLRALVALGLSLGLLVKFMLPAIIQGQSPLLVALVGSAAVMFLALYLSHGVNVRTTSAVLGTPASNGGSSRSPWPLARRHHHRGSRGSRRRHRYPGVGRVGAPPR